LYRLGSGYGCGCLLRLENRKEQTMTHSLYLSIIGAVVFLAAYIILRLLRNNERLILELEEAKAEARTLDSDLDEARRSNGKANEIIKQLFDQEEVLSESLSKYKKEAKVWKIRFESVVNENIKLREEFNAKKKQWRSLAKSEYVRNKKEKQRLYGRIGAMQRKINRLKSVP